LPCFDQPDIKSEFKFQVLAPNGWNVLTNFEKVTIEPLPKNYGKNNIF
jgi:aminopeptidase N